MMKISYGISALALPALAVAVGVGANFLPDSAQPKLKVAAVTADGRAYLGCMGGAESAVQQPAEVLGEANRVSGGAGVFLHGGAVHGGLWMPLSGAHDARAVTDPVPAGNFVSSSALSQPQLLGILRLDRRGSADMAAAGYSAHRAVGGDLRGIANSTCSWQTDSAWFVASETKVGTANRLVVINPAANPITVRLNAYGSAGKLSLGSAQDITVPAGGMKKIMLDGLIPEDGRIAFEVTSQTGFFTAQLQTLRLDGVTARGVDFVKPSVAGTDIYLPGLFLPTAEEKHTDLPGLPAEKEDGSSRPADSRYRAVLRIVNPGGKKQTVRVSVLSGQGMHPLPGSPQTEIAAKSVLDLSLKDLQAGDYALRIESQTPISAGVELAADSADAGTDIARISAVQPVRKGMAGFGVGSARLIVSAAEPARVKWTAFSASGEKLKTGTLEADSGAGADLPQGSAYVRVDSETEVYAGVALRDDLGNGPGVDWVPVIPGVGENGKIGISTVN